VHGGGPVYVSLVPQTPASESAGDSWLFAAAVHAKARQDGLYVVADPDDGTIDVYNYGLRIDADRLSFDLPDAVTFGDSRADEADDHLLGERLGTLMTFLDKAPRTDRPDFESTPAAAPKADEHTLPPLFATDFWPGLFVGAFAALLLSGAVAGVMWIAGRLRRRDPAPEPTDVLPFTAPTEPSASYLRRTAYAELTTLISEFTDPDDRTRAWDHLDAAMLLVDGDPDRARAAGADPATLVAVIVLARAGRAALADDTDDLRYDLCCGINPLHGSAVSRHHVRVSTQGNSRRLLPVCEPCRDMAVAEPGGIPGRLLKLPDPTLGNSRLPYYDATDGPLTAVPHSITRLIDKVRETAGVH
jgi:hypothetical protein